MEAAAAVVTTTMEALVLNDHRLPGGVEAAAEWSLTRAVELLLAVSVATAAQLCGGRAVVAVCDALRPQGVV